ncbi:MAG: energy transducer TonB [Rikenellaceae bacterium]
MELKKSPKADLQNKKGIFSLIGLIISLLIMIGMFSWSQSDLKFEKVDQKEVTIEQDIVEITRQEPPKLEAPKVAAPSVTDIIEIVKSDTKLDNTADLFSQDFDETTQIAIKSTAKEEEVLEEEVPVLVAEKMPTFDGGDQNKFRGWVQGKVVYPAIAEENNISGRVTCSFVIERDGKLSNIVVMQSPDKSLSDECIRVMKMSPKWTPGEQRGKPVRVKVIVPISFTFNK